jgi:transposase
MYNERNIIRGGLMSIKKFTDNEVAMLSQNPYVKRVSINGITYTDEFRRIYIAESEKGKTSGIIFREYGFDTKMLGKDRYAGAGRRWRDAYEQNGISGLNDTRMGHSGRPSEKEMSIEEKYERLKAQNQLLKAENELLKKIEMSERRLVRKK